MTRLMSLSIAVLTISSLSGCASSQNGGGAGGCGCGGTRPMSAPAPAPMRTPMPQSTPAPMARVCNAICPVMDLPVDPSVPTSVYRGKTVGFCCMGCKPRFDANPEMYAAKLP